MYSGTVRDEAGSKVDLSSMFVEYAGLAIVEQFISMLDAKETGAARFALYLRQFAVRGRDPLTVTP